MSTAPTHTTTWSDSSSRVTNLAGALNSHATELNTLLPGGVGLTSWTPALTATTTNPTLGTASSATGTYFQLGDWMFASFAVIFGTSGTDAGSGAYRVSMPGAIASTAHTNGYVTGGGHIYNPAVEPVFGIGPGCYKGVTFHNNTAVSTTVSGIVVNTNMPATPISNINTYAVTNPTTDRALDVTGNTLAQGLAVLGTLITDLQALLAYDVSDNTAHAVPWAWGASCAIIGSYSYPLA